MVKELWLGEPPPPPQKKNKKKQTFFLGRVAHFTFPSRPWLAELFGNRSMGKNCLMWYFMITTWGLWLRATYPCRLQNTSSLHHCGQQHCQALGNFDAQSKDPQKYCIITNPILELDIIHPWSKASPCPVTIVHTSPCPQGLSRVHRGLQQSSEGSQRPPVFEYLECSEVWCDVVGRPTRWSLLFIFGFLIWSSISKIQSTEKYSIVLC